MIDPGTALVASTGMNILSGAFGGGNSNPSGINYNMTRELNQRQKFHDQQFGFNQENWDQSSANTRAYDRDQAKWNLRNVYGKQIQTKVRDAKAAGLHPLFALGSAGYSPPSSTVSGSQPPQQGIAGQSSSGSFLKDGMQAAARGIATAGNISANKKANDLSLENAGLQNDLLRAQIALIGQNPPHQNTEPRTPYVAPNTINADPKKRQEFKPGDYMAHNPNAREQNANEISPLTKMRIGTQDVWVPVEEAADMMEDPVAVAAATLAYKGNRHVRWRKLLEDYTGSDFFTPYDYSAKAKMRERKVLHKSLLWGLAKVFKHWKIQKTGPK